MLFNEGGREFEKVGNHCRRVKVSQVVKCDTGGRRRRRSRRNASEMRKGKGREGRRESELRDDLLQGRRDLQREGWSLWRYGTE